MASASYAPTGRADSYEKRKLIEPTYPRDLAAIGLHASVNDLARLAVAMINPDLSSFSSDSILEMQRHQNADIPLDIDNKTGLAWQLTNAGDYRAKRILRINNASFGYSGLLLIAPEEEIGVAVLSNASDGFQSTIEIGQDLFDAALEAVTGRKPPDRDDFELVAAAMPKSATPALMSRFLYNGTRHYCAGGRWTRPIRRPIPRPQLPRDRAAQRMVSAQVPIAWGTEPVARYLGRIDDQASENFRPRGSDSAVS